jgi:hypothetical protein
MKLALHHRLALPAALGLSAIAIFDAITHGVTGHWSVFADDSGSAAAQALGAAVHGLAREDTSHERGRMTSPIRRAAPASRIGRTCQLAVSVLRERWTAGGAAFHGGGWGAWLR